MAGVVDDGSHSTAMAPPAPAPPPPPPGVNYPHITIRYCTQCKWMLRAAYFAQELLSTFSSTPLPPPPTTTSTTTTTTAPPQQQFTLPTISLIPSTGGIFTITLYHIPASPDAPHTVAQKVLWDRKTEGGFPETKELKRRVRDVVDPGRGLGHVDRDYGKKGGEVRKEEEEEEGEGEKKRVGEKKGVVGEEEMCIDCL